MSDIHTIETEPIQKIPQIDTPKHPLRQAIRGVVDKTDDLKSFVKTQALHAGMQDFILSEIDSLKSNAAEIHLHIVDQPNGGIDVHLTLRPFKLGS